jgi:hypothetical protein
VPRDRPRHLDVAAIPRGEEVGADQEQDDPGPVEVLTDDPVPLRAGSDAAVVLVADDPLVLEQA